MNPFDQLRAEIVATAPDPSFAARLRRRLLDDLTADLPTADLPDRSTTVTTPATSTPATSTPATSTIVPYLAVHDAAAAIDWYAAVFGAVETRRYVADDGRIGHADLMIGDTALMLSDEYPDHDALSPATLGGSTVALHLGVADVDAVWAAAIEHGADARRPPHDEAYGERTSTFVDPFGHRWMVATPISNPTTAEIDAASDGFTVIEPDG